jgi:uncharacterized membrane protein
MTAPIRSPQNLPAKIWHSLQRPALAWLVIAIGTFLRIYRFLQPRGVMHDEAVLNYNILTRNFAALFRPLESNQASPVGFLLLQKSATILFGNSEEALRTVPLIAGIIALPLFYRLAKKLLTPQAALLAVAFLALCEPAIFFSVDAKQYSTDVLWTILIFSMSLPAFSSPCTQGEDKGEGSPRDRQIPLLITGTVLIWFSHPILFVLGAIGLSLAWQHLRAKQWPLLKLDLATGAAWLASFAINYFTISRHYTASAYLTDYWQTQNSFAPLPTSLHNLLWYPQALRDAFEFPVAIAPAGNPHFAWILWLAAACFLIGILIFSLRRPAPARIILGTLLLTLIASALHRYPFGDRLLLFALPLFILPLALSIDALAYNPLRLLLTATFFIYPLYLQIKYTLHPPLTYDVKPAIAYVKSNWQPSDALYLPWGSDVLGRYYLNTQPALAIPDAHPIRGIWTTIPQDRPTAYAQDLTQLFGKPRVWIVFSMDPLDERPLYEQILAAHGKLLDRHDYPGGGAELYDLR